MVSYLDKDGTQHLIKKLKDRMHPVGSIYMSVNSTSPALLFGGNWSQLKDGRVLVSSNPDDSRFQPNQVGGSFDTVHSHWMPIGHEMFTNGHFSTTWNFAGTEIALRSTPTGRHDIIGIDLRSPSGNGTEETTYSQKVTTIQPYRAVYMWIRVS